MLKGYMARKRLETPDLGYTLVLFVASVCFYKLSKMQHYKRVNVNYHISISVTSLTNTLL